MRSPEEIKKALECCKNGECEGCCYLDGSGSLSCVSSMFIDTISCIQQLEIQHRTEYCEDADYDCKMLGDARKRTQQLEAQQPRWISVGERLPEEDGCVVCYLKDGSPYTVCVYFADGELFFAPGLNNVTDSVTHWMPMPQPPEEE